MRIEEQKPARRGGVILRLSDGRELRLPKDTAIRFSLYEGMELDEELLSRVIIAASQDKAKQTAANMVSARPLSEKELIRKLEEKGYSQNNANAAAEWLRRLGAVDDERYARSIVSHYSGRGLSARAVTAELKKRGIAEDMAEEALEAMPPPDDALLKLISARLRGCAPDRDEAAKTVAYLARKGFSYDDIRSAMRRYLEKTRDE